MEEYFKMNTAQLREKLRDMARDQQTIQQMQQKLVGDIKSTPSDVRRFFNNFSVDSIPVVPAEVELQIVSFEPPVNITEINRIKERLRDFTERVNSGSSDFSVLARLYSEDPGSAARGGDEEDTSTNDHHDTLLDILLLVVHLDVNRNCTDDGNDTCQGIAKISNDRHILLQRVS
jgi:hypothetical protein